jgi:hypothetical protein
VVDRASLLWLIGVTLTLKHWDWLKMFASEKHSSLFRLSFNNNFGICFKQFTVVNYDRRLFLQAQHLEHAYDDQNIYSCKLQP